MAQISVNFTVEQVKALLQISQNQLFRLKFLDPKMPGYKPRPGEVENAEAAVKVLEAALKIERKKPEDDLWATPQRRTSHSNPVR